ncbi:MAG: AroM family protein, partial [Ferrovibrio sp.]|uniref:AroM family protein n=1 Tax=Ferrovibrio sp. TaxID=1917215 RepID=UPI00262BAFAA
TNSSLRRRVASLTVGQTPRADVLPDILAHMPVPVEVEEFGALDGLSDGEIAALAPQADEYCLITRLRDGREVLVSKPRVAERLEAICRSLDSQRFDLVVILSTGLFREFESPCPMVNAQRAMEASIDAIAAAGQTVGVIYPTHRQIAENAGYSVPGLSLRFSYAESGVADSLREAATDLDSCDLIVLNSVSFTEADRVIITRHTGKQVILARRMVAGAIRLLLDPGMRALPPAAAEVVPARSDVDDRIDKLTPRERQVMSLVTEGLSNKAIARQLDISPRTVEIHRAKVMEKMEAGSVGALIRLVLAAQHADR